MAKRGRKRIIQITPEVFEGMCRVQCTETEIANILRCSIDTLRRWVRMTYGQNFATVYANLAEVGKMSLRRAQMKSAVDELNPSMLKWLGQQYLGQRDKQDIEVTVNDSEAYEEAIRTVMSDPDFTGTKADAIRWIKDNIKSGPLAQVDSVLASERIH